MKRKVWVCYLDREIKDIWYYSDKFASFAQWKRTLKTVYPDCKFIKGTLDFKLGK